jgi:hypothetical protein
MVANHSPDKWPVSAKARCFILANYCQRENTFFAGLLLFAKLALPMLNLPYGKMISHKSIP